MRLLQDERNFAGVLEFVQGRWRFGPFDICYLWIQIIFSWLTMLTNLIKVKMKLPLKLDQLVFVVPLFSLQMMFHFFVLLWHNSAELPSSQCKLDFGAARKSVTSNVHFCAASSYFPHIFCGSLFLLMILMKMVAVKMVRAFLKVHPIHYSHTEAEKWFHKKLSLPVWWICPFLLVAFV